MPPVSDSGTAAAARRRQRRQRLGAWLSLPTFFSTPAQQPQHPAPLHSTRALASQAGAAQPGRLQQLWQRLLRMLHINGASSSSGSSEDASQWEQPQEEGPLPPQLTLEGDDELPSLGTALIPSSDS